MEVQSAAKIIWRDLVHRHRQAVLDKNRPLQKTLIGLIVILEQAYPHLVEESDV